MNSLIKRFYNKYFYCLIFIFFSSTSLKAENLIVKLNEGDFNKNLISLENVGLSHVEVLSKRLNIHLFSVNNKRANLNTTVKQVNTLSGVSWAQENHKVSLRTTPNDPSFINQWSLSNDEVGVKARDAWAITTGGKDLAGNDIVVAVIDDGVYRHEDLVDNLWINEGEIPLNEIDDDLNGYVDDVYGWNALSNNPHLPFGRNHGTHVIGIVGAKGDNSKDIAGVNWNVKVMPIAGASGRTDTVIRAYDYALNQKSIWLETNGEKGANIVVTNSSFGVDLADCTSGSYPAWNDMYNALGEVGILSAAATANRSINVDERGDVPTGCDSPYIISVTNTTNQGRKNFGAAWGKENVDLGAPGTNILSTINNNRTSSLSGTSMATPHVAGAVALVHSAASSNLFNLQNTSPAEGALAIKDIILSTVSPQEDLANTTVSGGRLNLFKAVKAARDY